MAWVAMKKIDWDALELNMENHVQIHGFKLKLLRIQMEQKPLRIKAMRVEIKQI